MLVTAVVVPCAFLTPEDFYMIMISMAWGDVKVLLQHFIWLVIFVWYAKQDEKPEAQLMVTGEQMSTATVFQQSFQHFPVQTSQKPIDLSCHEMDVSIDCGPAPTEHQNADYDMEDSQGTALGHFTATRDGKLCNENTTSRWLVNSCGAINWRWPWFFVTCGETASKTFRHYCVIFVIGENGDQ